MALQKEHELPGGLILTGAVDFAHFWNSAGFDGASRDYLSGLVILENGPWAFGIAATALWAHDEDGQNRDEYNVKVGYSHELPSDMSFDASISVFERQGIVETETVFSLTKTIGFAAD
jgi:hypothetical protein